MIHKLISTPQNFHAITVHGGKYTENMKIFENGRKEIPEIIATPT